MFFTSKNKPQTTQALDRQQALGCVPLKNPQAKEERKQEGILLEYPVKVKPFFRGLSRLVTGKESQSIKRKIQLDTMGSGVWRLIDGKRSVEEVTELFRERHQLDRREAEISVSTFLKELGKRGLIALRPGNTS